jgi:excisionase family DNA binding protein
MVTERERPQLLRSDVAAKMLDIKPRTLHAWVRAGRVPAVKIGAQWRVKLCDIQALVDEAAG